MSCVAANGFQLSIPVIVGFAILFIAERIAINRHYSACRSYAGPLLLADSWYRYFDGGGVGLHLVTLATWPVIPSKQPVSQVCKCAEKAFAVSLPR